MKKKDFIASDTELSKKTYMFLGRCTANTNESQWQALLFPQCLSQSTSRQRQDECVTRQSGPTTIVK